MKQKPVIRQKTFHCGPQNKKSKYIEVDVFEHVETTATRKVRKKREQLTPPKQFESSVISYGSQTRVVFNPLPRAFESSVISYGSQTANVWR